VHLLKAPSKPTKAERKKKKVPILGTFDQYTESKKKPMPMGNAGGANKMAGQSSSSQPILQFMAPPPGGKNDAGKGKDAQMSGK